MDRPPLLAFSHVRWDGVYQRPQNVMTRMGLRRSVLFVEEPMLGDGEPWLETMPVAPGVRVCRPHLANGGPAFGPAQLADVESMLNAFMDHENISDHAAWLWTPAAVKLARALEPRAIIYDCTDELSAFPDVPAEYESELLAHADAVLTSGPGIFRARSDSHPFVRCFPNSVDVAHFARATQSQEPEDQEPLARPRLGYFGVIDERVDFRILDALALAHPEWEIVLVGPAVRIDPATLPRHPNLHYIGPCGHADLPRYLSGWDLGILPLVTGDATRFLNPTQVLEYLAAERPVVSTPLDDVVELHGDIAYLGDGPEAFVSACEEAIGASLEERDVRSARARRQLKRTSWDETVRRMDEILHYLGDFGRSRESVVPVRVPWTYEARMS